MTYSLLMLIFAIHGVESTYGKDPDCRGNEYQITRVFVDECNRIAKLNHSPLRFTYADRCDRLRSQEMMMVYLSFYGEVYRKHFYGREPSVKFYALVYHLGWTGWIRWRNRLGADAMRGDQYWNKVRRELEAQDGEVHR